MPTTTRSPTPTASWAHHRLAEGAVGATTPALLYLSDHGESLGEYGLFLHGLPYAFAPEVQKHVPMVAWFGDGAAARDGLDAACLRGGLDAPLTHDNLYHTVLGLMDVTTPTYDRRLDIWSRASGQ